MSDKCTVKDLRCDLVPYYPEAFGKVVIHCMVHGVIGECLFDTPTIEQARVYAITKMKDHLAEQNRVPTQDEIFERTIQFFV